MTSRDDIVITPRLKPRQAATPVRAREERRMAGAKRKRGLFGKLLLARQAHRLARIRRAKTGRRRLKVARGGPSAMAGARVLNPIGLIVSALVVAAAVTTRLATGKSFENLGQQVNNMLLGDMDETARANSQTRKRLGGDPDIARIIGQEGRVNSQIASLHKDLAAMAKRDMVGASLLRSEEGMSHNGVFDMLIIRARDKFLQAWNGSGGPDATERLRDKLQRRVAGAR